MPPIDLPRGNATKPAPPRPASAYRNPAPATVQQSAPARTVVPDARSHGSGTLTRVAAAIARPKSAYANPPAASKASPQPVDRLAKLTPQQRLSRLTAAMTQGAISDPFSPIAANGPIMTEPLKQMMFQGQFNQDFQRLQQAGLLPKGAQEPPLTFVSGGPNGMSDVRSYEKGSGSDARIFITPQTVAASQALGTLGRTWGLQTPIHELAHALQTPQTLSNVPLREGGAQAFADAAAVPALGPIAPADDTNYSGYVQMVRRLGPAWFMRKQFQ